MMTEYIHMLAIIVFLLGSCFAAWISFKVLNSSARIKNGKYDIGGAAAVLFILFSTCLTFYFKMLTGDCVELRKFSTEYTVAGRIIPNKPNVLIVLANEETTTGIDGTFRFNVVGVDRGKNSLIRLYVLDGKTFLPVNIYKKEEMEKVEIPLGEKE